MRFLTLFRYGLRSRLVQIIAWGGSLALLAIYLLALYEAFVSQQAQFSSMLSAYPPELMAFFGGTKDLFVPTGFLNFTYFSYVAVILGFLACASGAGLLAADEERGTLELPAAYPVSRLSLFSARLLALLVSLAAILALSWAGFAVASPGSSLKALTAWQYALPHFELLAFLFFFAGLGLLLSQVLPSRSLASAVAALLLLASYITKVLLELDPRLASIERWSPLHYLKGGYAIDGLNLTWVAGLAGLGLLFVLLAAWRFLHRDLRISGEGSWPAWR